MSVSTTTVALCKMINFFLFNMLYFVFPPKIFAEFSDNLRQVELKPSPIGGNCLFALAPWEISLFVTLVNSTV